MASSVFLSPKVSEYSILPVRQSATGCQKALFILTIKVIAITSFAALAATLSAPVAIAIASLNVVITGATIGGGIGFIGTSIFFIVLFGRIYKETGTPPLDPALDESPITPIPGNQVVITHSVEETMTQRLAAIRCATKSVEISGSFIGGKPFRDMLAAAYEARKKHSDLQIRITGDSTLLESGDKEAIDKMKKDFGSNCQVLLTEWKLRFYRRKGSCLPGIHSVEPHHKVVIVDETIVILGGTNSKTQMCRSNKPTTGRTSCSEKFFNKFWGEAAHDIDVVVQGGAFAKVFRLEFYKIWNKWAHQMNQPSSPYFPIPDQGKTITLKDMGNQDVHENVILRPLVSGFGKKENPIIGMSAHMIRLANQRVFMANMLFHLTPPIKDAMHAAAKSGKPKVTVMTNGLHGAHAGCVAAFGHMHHLHYHPLLKAAEKTNTVALHVFSKAKTLCHYKVTIGDDHTLITSANNGVKSREFDDEFGVLIESHGKIADEVQGVLESDLKQHSAQLTLEGTAKHHNSWKARLQAHLMENFAG